MKRKIGTILLCGLTLLCLVGCETKREYDFGPKSYIGEKSDIEIVKSDVSLAIKDGTLKNTGATVVLTNNSDKDFYYGNPYSIQIKKDGEWHKINVELSFTLPLYYLKAKEAKELVLNWEDGYGQLDIGEYRIIKSIETEKDDGTFESFYVTAEFTIE